MTAQEDALRFLATPEGRSFAAAKSGPSGALVQQIVDRFPEFATMLGIPEVADLLVKASAPGNNWTPQYFQEQLWNTKWWKETPESSRLWQTRKLVDPATAGEQSHTMAANVTATATSLGLNLSPAEVAAFTEFANGYGWDQAALTRALVDTHQRAKFHAGTVQSTADSLHATAANYGVNISDTAAHDWATKIATGRQTQDGFEAWARNHAKAAYPGLEKELDGGLTVRQIADPYIQIAAQTLGLNPSTMSLTDPKWQRALQNRGEDGKQQGPMTTLDWSRTLMTDPAYGYGRTVNGRTAALELRDALGKTFGVTT